MTGLDQRQRHLAVRHRHRLDWRGRGLGQQCAAAACHRLLALRTRRTRTRTAPRSPTAHGIRRAAPGTKVDASSNGGTTAFSTAFETAGITVSGGQRRTAARQPAGVMTLTDIDEDDFTATGDSVCPSSPAPAATASPMWTMPPLEGIAVIGCRRHERHLGVQRRRRLGGFRRRRQQRGRVARHRGSFASCPTPTTKARRATSPSAPGI